MENRFKFRAWYKPLETMLSDFEFHNTYTTLGTIAKDNNYVLMQCVGLKDVSGQLIYEGDIVLFGPNPDDIAVIEWDKDECKFIVDEIFNNTRSDFSNWFGEDLEIIGNIYKDPDLIGGKKQ